MKEVDLEKIIKEEYLKQRCYKGKDNMLVILTESDFNRIAKHFFELGLKQSSSDEFKLGEPQIYLEDDGGEPPYDGKQWLDLSCKEYEIPTDKFKNGDKIEIFIRKIKKGE